MKSAHTPTPKKKFNAYIWQMNDGNWHIDQRTNWRLDGYDAMPDYGAGFKTREAAATWLSNAEVDANDAAFISAALAKAKGE